MDIILQELKNEQEIERAINVLDEILEKQQNDSGMKFIRVQNKKHRIQSMNNENK